MVNLIDIILKYKIGSSYFTFNIVDLCKKTSAGKSLKTFV